MRVIIIEDEAPAATHLTRLLHNIDNNIEIVSKLDSVETAVSYLPTAEGVDLIFMDIQLADGLSFSIFEELDITIPVIFTTAFDQYTLKAFKVNSLDYLLKPIDEGELCFAIEKYRQLYGQKGEKNSGKDLSDKVHSLLQAIKASGDSMPLRSVKYKERLLIKRGRQLHYLKTEATAYCFADGKLCYAIDFNGNRFLVENNLNELEEQMPPNLFYRISRHLLVNIESVKKIHPWIGGRLKLELQPSFTEEALVSRERVGGFKEWLGQ